MNIKASIVSIVLLAGCVQEQPETVFLKEENIYNRDAVSLFLERGNIDKEMAKTTFLNGVDLYRNKKDAEGAVGEFVRSISISPDAKSYYELGNALLDNKDYKTALKAYTMAEQLGFEPLSKLLYNMACVHSLNGEDYKSLQYLEYAIEAGYSNKEQIFTDPDLANLRKDDYYKHSVVRALGGAGYQGDVLWESFKREFHPAEFPVVINSETQNLFASASSISYDFEKYVSEMRDGKFSREVGKEFYYYVALGGNESYTALVYAAKNIMAGEHAPCSYMLITCNDAGKLIDKMEVGGHMTMEDLFKVCTINENLFLDVREYRHIYRDDPEEKGYIDNPVVDMQLVNTEKYSISEKGKILKETPALTMN